MLKNKKNLTMLAIGLLLMLALSACAAPTSTPAETQVATFESVAATATLPVVTFQEQVINAWYARDAQAFASFYSAPVMTMSTQAPLENLDSADKLVASVSGLIPNAPAGTPAAITNADEILAQINYDPRKALADGEFALVGADDQAQVWVILVFKPTDQLFGILVVPMDYLAQAGPATPADSFQEQVINAWYARDHQAFASFYTTPVMLMGTSSPLDNLDSADKLVASASDLIPDAPAGTPAAITNADEILAQINYDPRRALADGEYALVGADNQARNWVVLVFKPSDQLFGILLVPMSQ
jgi:hypothetical protein